MRLIAQKLLAATVGSMMVMAANAGALLNDNTRPIPVNVTGSNGETTLQQMLDQLFQAPLSTPIGDVNANQRSTGLFASSATSSDSISSVGWEAAGWESINEFGIWFGTDSADLLLVPLFFGSADDGNQNALAATTAGIVVGNGELQISAATGACGTLINCTTGIGFTDDSYWDPRITPHHFGFFFGTNRTSDERIGTGSQFVYNPLYGTQFASSLDNLSGYGANEQPRFLAFQSGNSSDWAFAYEDSTDGDYNDFVVKFGSITGAVPLPGSLALLGIGLGGLGAFRRRTTS